MIVIFHKENRIFAVSGQPSATVMGMRAGQGLVKLAKAHPDELLLWCDEALKDLFDVDAAGRIFHHDKIMASYCPTRHYFGDSIGYVDLSPSIKVNKSTSYPTWQMSGVAGGIHAAVLVRLADQINPDTSFDYFLSSVAKLGMPEGLLCYSDPDLLTAKPVEYPCGQAGTYSLFRFVKQHYRTRWILLLLLNLMVYERRFPLLPFVFSVFYRKRKLVPACLDALTVRSSRKVVSEKTIDVIIPTIGREKYLLDVLNDLSVQTLLPKKVIIIEQNPDPESKSQLPYLYDISWPFEIVHRFTHRTGACNARNRALAETVSEWLFFADDDIAFPDDFLEKSLEQLVQFGCTVATVPCLQTGEKKKYIRAAQWAAFGTAGSFVRKDIIGDRIRFSMALEFGYGEDSDFGMRIRNEGHDVLYFPQPDILHFKAPMGGFRSTPVFRWKEEKPGPKPSPTVMVFVMRYHTLQQTRCYKTILCISSYKAAKNLNPFSFLREFNSRWNRSRFWAQRLIQEET